MKGVLERKYTVNVFQYTLKYTCRCREMIIDLLSSEQHNNTVKLQTERQVKTASLLFLRVIIIFLSWHLIQSVFTVDQ